MPRNWTIKNICVVLNNGEDTMRKKAGRMAFLQQRRRKLPGLYLLLGLTTGNATGSSWNLQISWAQRGSDGNVLGQWKGYEGAWPSVSDQWPSCATLSQEKGQARPSSLILLRSFFQILGQKNTWASDKNIEITVLLLMKINDCNDRITNTLTIQVTSDSSFSRVERGLIELSVDH